MEQYRGLYKHIEEVIKNLGQFKLFSFFFFLGLEYNINSKFS